MNRPCISPDIGFRKISNNWNYLENRFNVIGNRTNRFHVVIRHNQSITLYLYHVCPKYLNFGTLAPILNLYISKQALPKTGLHHLSANSIDTVSKISNRISHKHSTVSLGATTESLKVPRLAFIGFCSWQRNAISSHWIDFMHSICNLRIITALANGNSWSVQVIYSTYWWPTLNTGSRAIAETPYVIFIACP